VNPEHGDQLAVVACDVLEGCLLENSFHGEWILMLVQDERSSMMTHSEYSVQDKVHDEDFRLKSCSGMKLRSRPEEYYPVK